jgi:hypothetical protein
MAWVERVQIALVKTWGALFGGGKAPTPTGSGAYGVLFRRRRRLLRRD